MLYNLELVDVSDQVLKLLTESKNAQVLRRILIFIQDYVEFQGNDVQKIKNNYGTIQKGVEKLQENGNMEVRESASKIVTKMIEMGIECESELKMSAKKSAEVNRTQEKRVNKS